MVEAASGPKQVRVRGVLDSYDGLSERPVQGTLNHTVFFYPSPLCDYWPKYGITIIDYLNQGGMNDEGLLSVEQRKDGIRDTNPEYLRSWLRRVQQKAAGGAGRRGVGVL